MTRDGRQDARGGDTGGGSRAAGLIVLSALAVSALVADEPWTPAVVAAAGSMAGLILGFWGGSRLVARR